MAIGFSKEMQTGKKATVKENLTVQKRKPLKLMSKRAKAELKVWSAVKKERMNLLLEKLGHMPCEFCQGEIIGKNVLGKPDPHHNDRDRRNNELDNCRILHRVCHTKVHDENIKDVKSLL